MLWRIDRDAGASLKNQIAGTVLRAIADGELKAGEKLPAATELADALEVDRNTVLAAYRDLRDQDILEFQRGRGARVRPSIPQDLFMRTKAAEFIEAGRRYGYTPDDLITLIKEMT